MHARTLFVACYLFVLINDSTFIWTDLISPTNLWYFFLHIFCIGIRYGFFMRRVRRKEKMKKKNCGRYFCVSFDNKITYICYKKSFTFDNGPLDRSGDFSLFFFSFFVAFHLMLRQHNFCCFFLQLTCGTFFLSVFLNLQLANQR